MDKAVEKTFERAEGIDTISVEVFPCFVNTKKWLNKWQVSTGISLEVRASKFKRYYLCHIQAESLRWNILLCVLKTIENLCEERYILLPHENEDLSRYILINRHGIMRLAEVDFHFDFSRKELQIPSEEITGKRRFATTIYTKDHKTRKSLWIMYDRVSDLHFRNQLPKNFVSNIPYPTRIEIRLCRANCAYVHLDNIWGDFYRIFSRYKNFIAKTWRKHGLIFGQIPFTSAHPFFNHILYLSQSNKPLKVYGLQKTPRGLNKITENDIQDISNKTPLKDDEVYNELYDDFDKYKIKHIQVIHNHTLYSYIRSE